jgi:hypothetical protein
MEATGLLLPDILRSSLVLFSNVKKGHRVSLFIPKPSSRFTALVEVAKSHGVEVVDELPDSYSLIVDAIFGFSFSGDAIRPPFDSAISFLETASCPVVSIDVPSGWEVNGLDETSPRSSPSFIPDMVSPCSKPEGHLVDCSEVMHAQLFRNAFSRRTLHTQVSCTEL